MTLPHIVLGAFALGEMFWCMGYFISLASRFKELNFIGTVVNVLGKQTEITNYFEIMDEYINRQYSLTWTGYGIVAMNFAMAASLILALLMDNPRYIKNVSIAHIVIAIINVAVGAVDIVYATDWDMIAPNTYALTEMDNPILDALNYKSDMYIHGSFFILLGVGSAAFFIYNIVTMSGSGFGGSNRVVQHTIGGQMHNKRIVVEQQQFQQQGYSGQEYRSPQQMYSNQPQNTQRGPVNQGYQQQGFPPQNEGQQRFQQQPNYPTQNDGQ